MYSTTKYSVFTDSINQNHGFTPFRLLFISYCIMVEGETLFPYLQGTEAI